MNLSPKRGDTSQLPPSDEQGAGPIIRCAVPAIAVAWIVLLPFLNSAFRMDDVTFLLEAQYALKDPLHPSAFDMVFHGERIRLSRELVTGPVMAYLLVPAVLLGGAEWAAHLVQLLLLTVAILATASMALRLGLLPWQATLAALLLVAAPTVLAMSATAMADVPAMALAATAMERTVAWSRSRRWAAGAMAAILLALAALTRPHLLLLLGCAAYWVVSQPSPNRLRTFPWLKGAAKRLLPIILAFGALVLFNELTRDPASGTSLAGTTAHRSRGIRFWVNLANFPLQWTVAFPLGFLWPALRRREFFPRMGTIGAFLIGTGIAWKGEYLPVALFVGLGTAVLFDILTDAWRSRDRVQLVLGLWLLIPLAAVPYTHLPAKYLVPSGPAMAILLSRFDRARFLDNRLITSTVMLGGLLLGALITKADAVLAEIGREGGQIAAKYVDQGSRVWLDGAWGFQWYAMQAGAEPLAETEPFPREGDVVVTGLKARLVAERYPEKSLLYRKVFADAGGRIVGDAVGFYTFGPFPWLWGHNELGRIEVWRLGSPP